MSDPIITIQQGRGAWQGPQSEAPRCRKCGAAMAPGIALAQTYTGSPDDMGGDVVTMSPGGSGKVVSCRKCTECGWSVTAYTDHTASAGNMVQAAAPQEAEPVAWLLEDQIMVGDISVTTDPERAKRLSENRYDGKATWRVTPLYAHPAPAPAVPVEGDAYYYAVRLASSMWEKHYPEAKDWSPLDDTLGVLTQIDNMATGLVRARASHPAPAVPVEGAPDRIWAWEGDGHDGWDNAYATTHHVANDQVEYVRADIALYAQPAPQDADQLRAENERLREALTECESEIDAYIRQEYPLDHPVHERYRQRDFDANPARAALQRKAGE